MTAKPTNDTAVLTFVGRERLQGVLDRLLVKDPTKIRVKRNLWVVEDVAAALRGYTDSLSDSERKSLLRALPGMSVDDLYSVVIFASGKPRPRREESNWELPE